MVLTYTQNYSFTPSAEGNNTAATTSCAKFVQNKSNSGLSKSKRCPCGYGCLHVLLACGCLNFLNGLYFIWINLYAFTMNNEAQGLSRQYTKSTFE
jgi:hypothetical protein